MALSNPFANYQIKKFFEEFPKLSQELCDRTAIALHGGGRVQPTRVQGAQSYTVRVEDGPRSSIIQFRHPSGTLDVQFMAAVRQTYGSRLVPDCRHIENICGLDPLQMYAMNDVSGEALLSARPSSSSPPYVYHFPESHVKRTVLDFARTSIQSDYFSRLESLCHSLPERFRHILKKLQGELPIIFADDYPMVINHWDLVENNIHVDEHTGHLTGIVDWRDAQVGPFGTQFCGLECILGIRRLRGMDFHPQHIHLRQIFWDTLLEEIGNGGSGKFNAIKTARMVGVFLTNGDDFMQGDPDQTERELAVLVSMTLENLEH